MTVYTLSRARDPNERLLQRWRCSSLVGNFANLVGNFVENGAAPTKLVDKVPDKEAARI